MVISPYHITKSGGTKRMLNKIVIPFSRTTTMLVKRLLIDKSITTSETFPKPVLLFPVIFHLAQLITRKLAPNGRGPNGVCDISNSKSLSQRVLTVLYMFTYCLFLPCIFAFFVFFLYFYVCC